MKPNAPSSLPPLSNPILPPLAANIPVGLVTVPSRTPFISSSVGGYSLLNPTPNISLISVGVVKPLFFP